MFREFQKFIMRGNVLDLAVGVIIGVAFTAIVNSLVSDIFNPIIGILIGGVDLSDIMLTLRAAEGDNPAVTLNIGNFINAVIQFLIIAFIVFLIVRAFNRMMERFSRDEEPVEPTPDPAIETQKDLIASIERLNVTMQQKG